MSKQPYIPFYIGDYIKDTRILPLNVRGGWVDLILYMWNNNPKGELTGTYDDFARLMSCSKEEAILVIQTLNQKNIFAYTLVKESVMKIVSRKIKRMDKLSKMRQNVGKRGGNPILVNQKDNQELNQELNQKDNLNPEYEYEYNIIINKGGMGEKEKELKSVEFKEKILMDEMVIETICRKDRMEKDDVLMAIGEFYETKVATEEDKKWKSYSDFKRNLIYWMKFYKERKLKEKQNGTTKPRKIGTVNIDEAEHEISRARNRKGINPDRDSNS